MFDSDRVDETPHYFALVFEYVPGETLSKRLHQELPAPAVAARLVRILATAVHSMHEEHVLHLDLKPSNILLDYSRSEAWERTIPRVSDFGISAASNTIHSTPNGQFNPTSGRPAGCGTPPWTAPEQLLLTPDLLTPAADVHGLGSLLYALLTGQPPIADVTEATLPESVLHQQPAAPELLQPAVPPQLSSICLRCLEKHPADRYQSASELAAALDDWIAANSLLPRNQHSRRTLRFAVKAVLALSLIALPILLLIPRQPNRPAVSSPGISTAPVNASLADLVSLLATPAAALNTDSARQLTALATHHTQRLLDQNPHNSAELLRLGLLLQRIGERINSSIHAPLFIFAADLLRCSEMLIEQAHRLQPGDQRTLQELAAVRHCLGYLKADSTGCDNDPDHKILREQIRRLRQCADAATRMTDSRQQVYWLGQVLDSGRTRSLHIKWSGHPELASEIRREITDSLPVGTSAAASADLRFRMLLWEPAETSSSLLHSDQHAETWVFPDSTLKLQLEAVSSLIADTIFSAPTDAPMSSSAAQQRLAEARVLMERLGLQPQLLPQILNEELVRPVAGLSSKFRVSNRLDDAERTQKAWLLLCTEAHQLFPDHPEIHLALSEAHLQDWKNMLRRDRDDDAIAALRKSQAAAEVAWQLAPESEVAYRQIADRLQRLQRFTSGN
ncbi:MAG UNVERIFIED_CONTAM: serine/threonine protein kinase [Planctomycetaceae bacterium]